MKMNKIAVAGLAMILSAPAFAGSDAFTLILEGIVEAGRIKKERENGYSAPTTPSRLPTGRSNDQDSDDKWTSDENSGDKWTSDENTSQRGTKKIRLQGTWSGSPTCPIKFIRLDENSYMIQCENDGFMHQMPVIWDGDHMLKGNMERFDKTTGCKTSSSGYVSVIDEDNLVFRFKGFNGCGVNTGPGTENWTRN